MISIQTIGIMAVFLGQRGLEELEQMVAGDPFLIVYNARTVYSSTPS